MEEVGLQVGPQQNCKLGCGTGYKKIRWCGVSVSRGGNGFGGVTNLLFSWHPLRALMERIPTSKYCTSNKTPFPAVQMKKISLRDAETTMLPLL